MTFLRLVLYFLVAKLHVAVFSVHLLTKVIKEYDSSSYVGIEQVQNSLAPVRTVWE